MIKLICFCAAASIAIVIALTNINLAGPVQRALAIFVFVAILWATEALPIYITSLTIPILVVTMRVILVNDILVDSAATAKVVMGAMMSDTVLVALGAFTMSLALTKYELSYRLAYVVLSRVGKRPSVVLLAVMFLGLFLSMWINNVASPVVVVSVVTPLLQELSAREPFTKVLLLGIAYSNNIGGMMSPISSPQNLVALNVINSQPAWNTTNGLETYTLGWGPFLAVSVPFAIACTFIAWGTLLLMFRPKLASIERIPKKDLKPLGVSHVVVFLVCVITIILWAVEKEIESFIGSVGMIALIPVIVFFAFPILEKSDFKDLSWDILMLLSGGLVLGEAIKSSGLLYFLAESLKSVVSGSNTWVVLAVFGSFIWLFSNFISHTVAAIIVLPIVAAVGCQLGGGNCTAGRYQMLVMGSVLIDSGAMALPVSSFPNVQCFAVEDLNKERFLTTMDFVKTGFLIGLFEVVVLISLGYGLLMLVFEQ